VVYGLCKLFVIHCQVFEARKPSFSQPFSFLEGNGQIIHRQEELFHLLSCFSERIIVRDLSREVSSEIHILPQCDPFAKLPLVCVMVVWR
jgi:hypothetical protein